jgi:hypothetical protein
VVVDDDAAELKGLWTPSSSIGGYVGACYRHDGNEQKGMAQAVYRLMPPRPGRYVVLVSYTPNPNRASNVPVEITHAGGTLKVTLNQRKPPARDQSFQPLGELELSGPLTVTISNAGTDGYVVIDAVQLLPVAR